MTPQEENVVTQARVEETLFPLNPFRLEQFDGIKRLAHDDKTPEDGDRHDRKEDKTEVDRLVFEAAELMKARRYGEARPRFESALSEAPWKREALLGLAELSFRAGDFPAGLERTDRALQLDAYDAEANFLAGTLYRAIGRTADARDAFGWAARSTAYRAAAYTQLADCPSHKNDSGSWISWPLGIRFTTFPLH